MWQRDCLFSHSEGCADGGDLQSLAEPGGQLLGVTLQVAFKLGRGHAAHFRDLLLVDMQLARLNMGKVDLAPFALAAAVAVVLAVHHVSEVLELIGLARDAKLFVDATRRGGRDVFPGERMAGTAIGQHPAPQAFERTATTEQQARVFALALDQKIQVELAQLRYRAVRLVGLRNSLSRLGGGIGTRGPGETKLEVDRRRIHERISQLKSELQDVERHRDVVRKQREQSGTLTAAIVGYTNAGKSTLLNKLTGAGILAEDKLFATLDPTTRALVLPGGEKVLLTDTVGFIRKLPHHLVEAFKSTLEEARYCDVILHVVDCSNPQMDMQMHVVYETLRRLDIKDKEIITVFNKVDRPDADTACRDMSADYKVRLSAKTGEGIGELLDLFAVILRNRRIYFEKVFAYKNAGRIQTIRKSGQLLSEEYQDDGIHVKAYVPVELFEELYKD